MMTVKRASTVIAASMACLALVTTACSKSPASPSVAALTSTASAAASGAAGSSAPANVHASLLAYSQCMRAHGVPDFPDPVGDSLQLNASAGSDLSPDSPLFAAAEKVCKSLEPTNHGGHASAKDQANALKYAACMRSHGVPDFPDPVFKDGGIQQQVNGNPNSPQFKAADKACAQYQPIAPDGGEAGANGGGPATGAGPQTQNSTS